MSEIEALRDRIVRLQYRVEHLQQSRNLYKKLSEDGEYEIKQFQKKKNAVKLRASQLLTHFERLKEQIKNEALDLMETAALDLVEAALKNLEQEITDL